MCAALSLTCANIAVADDGALAPESHASAVQSGAVFDASSSESLRAAFDEAPSGSTVRLTAAIDIADFGISLVVPPGKELALDLNGNTLKAANTRTGNIQVYGTLTIRDSTDEKANGGGSGKIYTETEYTGGATGYALVNAANGGAIIMQSGLIDSSSFTDDNTNKGQFAIGVDNVTSDASFTMNGGKITSGWYAVCGNGQLQSHSGNITVNGGILESVADYAIYCPQMGAVEINGGVVYGAAGGVHMNSGRLLVSGGTITSKGVGDTGDWGDGTGGSNCAAINVKASYGDVSAKITGGTITAEGGCAGPIGGAKT